MAVQEIAAPSHRRTILITVAVLLVALALGALTAVNLFPTRASERPLAGTGGTAVHAQAAALGSQTWSDRLNAQAAALGSQTWSDRLNAQAAALGSQTWSDRLNAQAAALGSQTSHPLSGGFRAGQWVTSVTQGSDPNGSSHPLSGGFRAGHWVP